MFYSFISSCYDMWCLFSTLMDNGFLLCLPYHCNKSMCPVYYSQLIVSHIIHCIFNFFLFIIIFYLLYDGFNILHDRKNFSWHCSRQTRRRAYLQIGYAVEYLLFFFFITVFFISTSWKKKTIIWSFWALILFSSWFIS
jgi:hypothetical protein